MKKHFIIFMVLALVFMLGQPDQLPRKARSGHDLRNNYRQQHRLGAIEQAYAGGLDEQMVECVDCTHRFSNITDRSLRLDSSGRPHMAYGEKNLYYAWYDGEAWQNETVDDSDGVGQYASLALDKNGFPHISYEDKNLKYAYQDLDGFHIQVVDGEYSPYTDISLTLELDGYPHISYMSGTYNDHSLKYAHWDLDGWHIQTVGSQGNVGWGNSLALDADGYPHISYIGNGLRYAYWDESGWHIKFIDDEDVGYWTSLALDSHGRAHISYGENGKLKYAVQGDKFQMVFLPFVLR